MFQFCIVGIKEQAKTSGLNLPLQGVREMKMFKILPFTILFLVLLVPLGRADDPDCNVDFETVIKAQNTAIFQASDFVITNEDDWCDFWDQVYFLRYPPPPCDLTLVDFETEVVIVTALGTKPNGCYNVEIVCIEGDEENNLTVYVRDVVPGPRCFCPMMMVSPVHAVKVARPIGDVEYTHSTTILRCGGWK
jgi:hypothetical protein